MASKIYDLHVDSDLDLPELQANMAVAYMLRDAARTVMRDDPPADEPDV